MGACGTKEVSQTKQSGVTQVSVVQPAEHGSPAPVRLNKLVLVGSEASGKTTFCKQAVNHFMKGYSLAQRLAAGYTLQSNIVHRVNSVCGLVEFDLETEAEAEEAKKELQSVSQCEFDYIRESKIGSPLFVTEVSAIIEGIISNKKFMEYCEQNFYRAPWDYRFLNHNDVQRIFGEDYVPTDLDISWCRKPTTNNRYQYDVSIEDGKVSTLVDVGGSRQERSKWTKDIKMSNGIIFMISLTDYANYKISHNDHFAYVSNDNVVGHRFLEDIALFSQILATIKSGVNIILVLTKVDLMKEMIMTDNPPLKETMPEYDGPDKDPEAAIKFLTRVIMDTLYADGLEQKVKQLQVMTVNLVELSACADVIDRILNGFKEKHFQIVDEDGDETRPSAVDAEVLPEPLKAEVKAKLDEKKNATTAGGESNEKGTAVGAAEEKTSNGENGEITQETSKSSPEVT